MMACRVLLDTNLFPLYCQLLTILDEFRVSRKSIFLTLAPSMRPLLNISGQNSLLPKLLDHDW